VNNASVRPSVGSCLRRIVDVRRASVRLAARLYCIRRGPATERRLCLLATKPDYVTVTSVTESRCASTGSPPLGRRRDARVAFDVGQNHPPPLRQLTP